MSSTEGSQISRTDSFCTTREDPEEQSYSADIAPANTVYQGLRNDPQGQNQIRELARTFSRRSLASISRNSMHSTESKTQSHREKDANQGSGSTLHVPGEVPFFDDHIDPRLDPKSDEFDSMFWVQNLRKLYLSDKDYYKPVELGVCLKGLRVSGISNQADYQSTVLNLPFKLAGQLRMLLFNRKQESRYFDILKPLDALFEPGRLCAVLGRPGSGCSTLLKTVSASTYGFTVQPESVVSYDGITQREILSHYRGDVVYSSEVDDHFATLPVGYTLEFAARCRCPRNRPEGVTREQYYKHYAAVTMATFGLLHTYDTKVGDDYIRGVSGGERKRVSIAEVTLAGSKVQCWDNSTRGLDSATALEFVRALKTNAEVARTTSLVAVYQCSQDAYNLFDDVSLLYEGYQIYFGSASAAKQYFLDMGWACPPRQTTADFLTSLTSPSERQARPDCEHKVPRTAREFYDAWRASPEYASLVARIDERLARFQDGATAARLKDQYKSMHARQARNASPFLISFGMQVKAVIDRNFKRIKGDPSVYLFNIIANSLMGLLISSMFYNQKNNTDSFYMRASSLFTAALFNSFSSLLEIMALFEARKIVEKHKRYAFYHPSADALASIITELPSKILVGLGFNLTFYFMINLRRTPGHFFFYFLITMTSTFAMSHLFRTIGAASTSLPAALSPAVLLLLVIAIYVGFVIPKGSMLGWSKWLYYLNPIARSMEALVANEFAGRTFECASFVPAGPGYEDYPLANKICSVVGAVSGSSTVSGTVYIEEAYSYYSKHRWRNWGIVLCYAVFFLAVYMVLIEYNKGEMQKGDVVLFTRSALKRLSKANGALKGDIESNDGALKQLGPAEVGGREKDGSGKDSRGTDSRGTDSSGKTSSEEGGFLRKIGSDDIFHWKQVCYDVKVKGGTRRILSEVDGWVRPGTLTALMGSSGAGKTTLLDVLASRVKTGVITGQMFVNGHPRDESFQRSTGYCQQQDLHGRTDTVREALQFSAHLRQPRNVSRLEKDQYVEEVIQLLEMEQYADAVVGVAGEGLNVEQRKRLTIGVELVAKPKLLLFLDEPTSGLDSQTAWSVCQLMRKLANHGQAILCTIHQPSAILMQEFDRLLLLAKGGKTIYFGDLGKGCHSMIEYFERCGSEKFPSNCNPAEFMLKVIGAAPGSHAKQDYHEVWKRSEEYRGVQEELARMEAELVKKPVEDSEELHREFASPLLMQYFVVTKRVFVQQWRTPGYIWAKIATSVFASILLGFSFFKANNSLQGLQNQMFSMLLYTVMINPLVQQMLPQYCDQRDLYEARERPSKTFSWKVFVLSQTTAELPWCIFIGTLSFFCFYYPVGLYRNAENTSQLHERGALFWLLCVGFHVFSITYGQLWMAGIEQYRNAAMLANTCYMLSMTFCGVLVSKDKMPGFWKFMYRVSPITYFTSAMLAVGVGNTEISCSKKEYLHFDPPSGTTCGQYMKPYISYASGYLLDGDATADCSFCRLKYTNTYLETSSIFYSQRWRNWGIFLCYPVINIIGFCLLYWMFRVPKSKRIAFQLPFMSKKGSEAS